MNVLGALKEAVDNTVSMLAQGPTKIAGSVAASNASPGEEVKNASQMAFGWIGNAPLIIPSVAVLFLLLMPPRTRETEDGNTVTDDNLLVRVPMALVVGFIAFGVVELARGGLRMVNF